MADFLYRITRTQIRGQFANDACFVQWLLGPAADATQAVKAVDDPLNNGGPNDARYYLWVQVKPIQTPDPKTCDVALVTRDGKNGWPTQAEAQAVLDAELQASGATAAMVAKANAAAVSPENIAKSAVAQLGKDVGDVAKGALSGGLRTWIAGAAIVVGGAVLAAKVLGRR